MKKALTLAGILFLLSINMTTAVAPTKDQIITSFVPVHLPERPFPTILVTPDPPTPAPTKKPVVKPLKPKPVVVYAKSAIKAWALARIGPVQFVCLDKLFTRESNWRVNAHNSSSGAYGIPQALPGSKMASAGKDWRTNPYTQVKWGLKYIDRRYGSACKAWQHSENHGWY